MNRLTANLKKSFRRDKKPKKKEAEQSDQEKEIGKETAKEVKEDMSASTTKVAVIYYSMYGHVRGLADSVAEGLKSGGAEVTIFQVPEILPDEVLKKMGASRDTTTPVATADALKDFDGIVFGVPTRFGMAAAQVKAFLDSTGGLWLSKALTKKTGGIFFSTNSQNGGQETTAMTFITQFVHHGMIYIPQGYTHPSVGSLDEIHGGSPWGPGTLAGIDGSRQPSKLEKEVAESYGTRFASITGALKRGGL